MPEQREQRHEHQHDDERGVDDAGAHFVGGGTTTLERRSADCPARVVLAQAPKDVLDIDDRVVDEFADGDREAAERHRVDGQAHQLENDGGRQDRKRDRGERNRASCAS